jgi:hypothetical protein
MAAVLAAGLLGVGESAKAGSTTFLQFFQLVSSTKPFSLTYGSSGSVDNAGGAAIPILINVDPAVGGSGSPVAALMTHIHLTFASGATFGGGTFSQALGAGTIDITTAAGLVLHVDLTGGLLSAVIGSGSVTASVSVPVDSITYSSTVFPLIGGWNHEQNLALSFSSLSSEPTGTSGGFLTGSAGVMSGSGTFAGAPVPEPGTLTLALCAVPVLGLVGLRRRLRKA